MRYKLLAALSALLLLQGSAFGQSQPQYSPQSVPVGLKPLGVAINAASINTDSVWVANSGDNSVSGCSIRGVVIDPGVQGVRAPTAYATMSCGSKVQGIPSPYAISACPGVNYPFIVTSPSANLISVISYPPTKVVTINVGSQPYSAYCTGLGGRAVVSNYGDNSLSVVDLSSNTTTTTIPNVPGSRGLHGIAVQTVGHLGSCLCQDHIIAWVAGTDANVVTEVDVDAAKVLLSVPFPAPSTVMLPQFQNTLYIASSRNNIAGTMSLSTLSAAPQTVPTPQDIAVGTLGTFVSTGPGNSVLSGVSANAAVIPGIPGAAGMAAGGSNPYVCVFTMICPTPSPPPYVVVASTDSNSVFLIQATPPFPHAFSVANAASFASGQAASGSLASLFASTPTSDNLTASSFPLPRTLGGMTVSVGGTLSFAANSGWTYSSTGAVQAPLLFAGPNQINFQVPPGITPGNMVPVQFNSNGVTHLSIVNIEAAAPGIFTLLQNGQGQAAVLNQDNSQNFGTNPAARGSVIQIYATGAGDTTPSLMPGQAADPSGNPLVLTNVQPTVTIGSQQATVLFSGMAPGYVGLWQINAQIPQSVTPGAVPLVITAGGVSSNTVTIAVQ